MPGTPLKTVAKTVHIFKTKFKHADANAIIPFILSPGQTSGHLYCDRMHAAFGSVSFEIRMRKLENVQLEWQSD